MAKKYQEKKVVVEAEQFDSSTSPLKWPVGVQVNASSSTGYSYLTLAIIPLPGGHEKVDGFPIRDLDYLIKNNNNEYFSLSPSEFALRFELKNGAFSADDMKVSSSKKGARK